MFTMYEKRKGKQVIPYILDSSFYWFITPVPIQEYVVTITRKVGDESGGSKCYPRKVMRMCLIPDSGECTDAYGKHHSFIAMARSFQEAMLQTRNEFGDDVHITRIENAVVVDQLFYGNGEKV